MNYLYLGQNDFYLPATAACMHLHKKHILPSDSALLELPYFRPAAKNEAGRLILVGQDASKNHIYIASIPAHPDVFMRGIYSLLGVNQLPLQEMQVIPCILENPQVGVLCRLLMRCGLTKAANAIGLRVVKNRRPDLIRLTPRLA